MILLVYYNINHKSFYQIDKSLAFDFKVGELNGFGHLLVQAFYIKDKKVYNVQSNEDIYNIPDSYVAVKRRFIKRVIRFLNKKLKKL